ncbi:MAG: VanZ family protein [Nitrospiraceae bacterium]
MNDTAAHIRQDSTPGPLDRTIAGALWYWIPPIAYAVMIFYLSSLSHQEETLQSLLDEFGDKTFHMIEYGILAVLSYRAFRYAGGSWAAQYAAVLAMTVSIFYGASDEVHQAFVPLREASGWDLMADSLGAVAATLAWRTIADMGARFRNL